jgi:hypothetical protein
MIARAHPHSNAAEFCRMALCQPEWAAGLPVEALFAKAGARRSCVAAATARHRNQKVKLSSAKARHGHNRFFRVRVAISEECC